MASKKQIKRTGWREFWGIVLLAASVLVLLSEVSYRPGDISLFQSPPQRPPANFVGPVGAWLTFILFMGLGVVGYLVPVAMAALGLTLVVSTEVKLLPKLGWLLVLFIGLTCIVEMQSNLWVNVVTRLNLDSPGGLLGILLAENLIIRFMGVVGASILSVTLMIISLTFLLEIRPVEALRSIRQGCSALFDRAGEAMDAYRDRRDLLLKEEREIARQRKKLEKSVRGRKPAADEPEAEPKAPVYARTVEDLPPVEPNDEAPVPAREPASPPPRPQPKPKPKAIPEDALPETTILGSQHDAPSDFQLPGMDMLKMAPVSRAAVPTADLTGSSKVLEETLRDFGIECKVTHVEQGPVVTRYQVLPAAGVRVERISGLSNNIALALKAVSVRVQAPIPGKGVVGIEVPNGTSDPVFLRELMESEEWTGDRALPLALGKDVAGRVLIADLAAMPHLLIAGATGAGKTVCMNSLLAGLLMTRTPEQMRLMLIDPKIVEFGPYNGMPHLVVPVITDPKKVGLGLRWAINEMEKRYKTFAKVGVRNIKDFNTRPREEQTDLFGADQPALKKEKGVPLTLPYIVIVIDELADLMLAAQAEIENSIARLAQLSRAVGIHMIIATQRPSVNVITGTIKANFPARLAFQVAQKVDSRTILDTVGADKLLGRGDMLFLPPGSSKVVRAQGAFTADEEIRAIVDFVNNQGQPEYVSEIQDKIEGKTVDVPEIGDHEDELMDAAIEIIRQTRRASTSSLQRRLRIGYTRAARLMDILEEKGIIGPPQGSDPREIMIDLDGEIPENENPDTID